MTVFHPGAVVTIGENLTARILGVMIDKDGTTYKIGYWIYHDWKETWLPEAELNHAGDCERMPIGFHVKSTGGS